MSNKEATIDREIDTGAEAEQRAWLTLLRVPGLGPKRLQALLTHFSHPQAILAANRSQLRTLLQLPDKTLDGLVTPDTSQLEQDLAWLAQPCNHLISIQDHRYPRLLKELPDPPMALFVSGRVELLDHPQIAIVGSRNPDHYGEESAHDFAKALAQSGLSVTSGLALGVDAAAHRGALAGPGDTLAVAATGLDRVYPARHKALAHEIVARGALISEQPLGTPPLPQHFPRRNRIISGLSLGTLVVQAALQSGSLITARLAMEQGREVFALPGSVHNPLSRGCHSLIRQGAKLVETTQDILLELAPQLRDSLARLQKFTAEGNNEIMPDKRYSRSNDGLTALQQKLLNHLGYEACSIDILVERSQLSSDLVSSMLLELELTGHVKSQAGRYCRIQ